ncbi:hypothetical protein ACH5RR_025341 [Cinchona calisaya]|uniref:Uncharacterized protein n=1 Tax=Cinchona calisaya TaxID=153742 RepID=A0ABD2YZC7_9GENT
MLVGHRNNTISLRDHKIINLRHAAAGAISSRSSTTRCCLNFSLDAEWSRMARIKEMFGGKIELSVSAYDTAWVAMVPSRDSPNKPSFPQCLDWIIENQQQDGSWGLLPKHPLLVNDSLSCTMACVLALTKWRVGEQLVTKGLEFVGSHVFATTCKDQLCPIGFDIVFPSMMNEAIKLGLNLPFDQVMVDHMSSTRKSVIERYWQMKSEEIFLDTTCCAVAFRLLRMHGYEVSSDELQRFADQEQFFDTISIQYTNIITILELYRASVLKIHQHESSLDKINAWTSSYLKQQLLDQKILDERLHKEDQIKDIRDSLHTAYFLIAADLFNPELSESRLTYALITILTTIVDDLFDKCASKEELLGIIDLIKKWDEPLASDYCSNHAEIFYSAVWKKTNEMATKAFVKQGRCVKNDIIRLWLDVLESMMKELEWWSDGVIPTMEEYLSVAIVTISCQLIIFSALCFLGHELPEEVLRSDEYSGLVKHISIIGRLCNDLQTYEREMQERKVNSVTLQLCHGNGEVTLEEAIIKIKGMIENSRMELLQIVLQTKGSRVPRMGQASFLPQA